MSFENLPIELRAKIFDYLIYHKLLAIEPTCKSFMDGVAKCFEWRCSRNIRI